MIPRKHCLSLLICYTLSSIFSIGCMVDKSPLFPNEMIDPRIVGDWYHRESSSLRGIPTESIYGIKILENGNIQSLAVEWASGKLKEIPTQPIGTFLNAFNGRFTLKIKHMRMIPETIYSSTYKVDTGELCFETITEKGSIPFLFEKYLRSKVGNKITTPVQTNFAVMVGSTYFTNAKISTMPSAYLSYFYVESDTIFGIHAFSQDHQHLNIQLENFKGTGTYGFGSEATGNAWYYVASGDVIAVITTDQHPYAGSLTIETFDLANKTCSGTFNFQIEPISFTNGHFQIPIYD